MTRELFNPSRSKIHEPHVEKPADPLWAEWWFIHGGGVMGAWKYRKWLNLRELARILPKAAWDHQQKRIDSLQERLEQYE